MVESLAELHEQIFGETGWNEDTLEQFLDCKETGDCIELKERTWITPRKDYKKFKKLLTDDLGAEYTEHNGLKVWRVPKRRKVEASETALDMVDNGQNSRQEESQPANLAETIIEVSLSALNYGVFSPRAVYDERKETWRSKTTSKYIDELVDALDNGEALPLPLVRLNSFCKERYDIVDGEHTCLAHEKKGFKTVKVELRDLNDEQCYVLALKRNDTHGLRVEPIERARHIQKTMKNLEKTQIQVAEMFGRKQPWASKLLALLKLPEENIPRGISPKHGEAVRELAEEDQPQMLEKIGREDLSSRQAQDVVERIKERPEDKEAILKEPYTPRPIQCGFSTFEGYEHGSYNPKYFDGIPVCSHHQEMIEKNPELLKELGRKPSAPSKVEKHEYKPKEKWEHRAARMKISPSKMDEDVYLLAKQNQELKDMGWEVIFQEPFVLTVSDLTLKRGEEKKAFFNDHKETHKNKRDSDTEKRELLMKFHPNVTAIPIDYDATTKPTDILKQILEEAKKP